MLVTTQTWTTTFLKMDITLANQGLQCQAYSIALLGYLIKKKIKIFVNHLDINKALEFFNNWLSKF